MPAPSPKMSSYRSKSPFSTSSSTSLLTPARLPYAIALFLAFLYLLILVFKPSTAEPFEVDYTDGSAPSSSRKSSSSSGYSSLSSVSRPKFVDISEDIVPLTTHLSTVHGYNTFSNLYLHLGSLTFVHGTPKPQVVDSKVIMRGANQDGKGPGWAEMHEGEAGEEMGVVGILEGLTFIFTDPPGHSGYLAFFSHFLPEAFVGAYRSHAAGGGSMRGMDLPRRVLFPRCRDDLGWVDDKSQNAWLLNTLDSSMAIEEMSVWNTRAKSGRSFMFERVVIIDRWAAHSGPGEVRRWNKMNADISNVKAPLGFFKPVQDAMAAGTGAQVYGKSKPVVCYIDNQDEGRRLNAGDHDALVKGLKGVTDIAEVHVVKVKHMSMKEQIALFGRADIIISVHHPERMLAALWMPATTTSTVIEIFDDGAFAPDNFLASKLVGHHYIAVNKDHVVDIEALNGRVETPGFHGNNIRVDGQFMKGVVRGALVDPPVKGTDDGDLD